MDDERKEDKFVGGKVSQDLYWAFKQAYTQRKESATEALSHAICLYLEITNTEEGNSNG